MKKRTRQIDDAREVVVGSTPNGPLHTTVGDMTMSEDDKAALQHNVNRQARVGSAEQAARAHADRVAVFYLKALVDLAPRDVVRDYVAWQNGMGRCAIFNAWFESSGLHFSLDGLTAFVERNGRVLATLQPRGIPEAWRPEVLKQFQGLMAGGGA